jgi:hypothetical protein
MHLAGWAEETVEYLTSGTGRVFALVSCRAAPQWIHGVFKQHVYYPRTHTSCP